MLCAELARANGRPLTLHAVDLPEFPFGMWIDDGRGDRILYRSSAAGYHRDHIVLHEICHLLVARERQHPAVRRALPRTESPEPGTGPRADSDPRTEGARTAMALRAATDDTPAARTAVRPTADDTPEPLLAHSPAEEELAEMFASLALKRAGRLRPRELSPVERRAAQLLGVDDRA
ncbi:hypothetical protein [Streptomyces sp. Da 82-17]|uniref:hypothetical protein n=1 Tax=Streptomyces sp. Da 82-17 TaxID=3377116 RepID=UPI0038D4DB25